MTNSRTSRPAAAWIAAAILATLVGCSSSRTTIQTILNIEEGELHGLRVAGDSVRFQNDGPAGIVISDDDANVVELGSGGVYETDLDPGEETIYTVEVEEDRARFRVKLVATADRGALLENMAPGEADAP